MVSAMKVPQSEKLLTQQQAAKEVLNVSIRTLRNLSAPRGPIPVVRIGSKCVRYSPSQLAEYIRQKSEGAFPPQRAG
jgi:hypothetical protein